MKKLLMLCAAALALAVAPASADTSTTYGPAGTGPGATNATSNWTLNGAAAAYCTIGTASSTSGANVSVTTLSGGTGADGTINITQLQGPNDHSNAWNATIDYPNAICNTDFTVHALSINGGLKNPTSETATGFTATQNYVIQATFGSHGGSNQANDATVAHSGTSGVELINNGTPTVGTFELFFRGLVDSTNYLLAGNYTDSVTVTMSPVP